MKNLYSRLALITSVTLITGYLIVSAATWIWTPMATVGTGDQLSANLWNTFVGNLNNLDERLKSTASTWPTVTGGIAYTGGNVGIGTPSPGKTLDVAGAIRTNNQLISTVATGTSPLSVTSTTAVMNLNTDLLDGQHGSYYAPLASPALTGAPTAPTAAVATNTTQIATTAFVKSQGYLTSYTETDPKIGANTINYLPKWSGSAFVASGLFESGGSVGIGTAIPSDKLTLSGSSGPIIGLNGPTTNYRGLKMSDSAGTEKWFAGANNLGNYVIRQDNTADLMTFSGGNVGIGTVVPDRRLQVSRGNNNSSTRIDGFVAGGPFSSLMAGSDFGSLIEGGDYSQIVMAMKDNDVYDGFRIISGGGNYMADSIYDTAVFTALSSGNVGIGTISPSDILTLSGSTGPIIGLNGPTTNYRGLKMSDSAGAEKWFAGVNNLGNYVIRQNNTTDLMTFSGGNVGIGTTNPGSRLQVAGNAYVTGYVQGGTAIIQAGTSKAIFGSNGSSIPILITRDTVDTGTDLYISSTGNVGIGTTDPLTYKLYVNGTGYLGAAAWVYSSDRRLKEKITPLNYGIKEIMKLDAKKFDYIKGEKNNLGFIAQDVQSILPELVTAQPSGMLGLKTDMIIPVLVKAMQELKKENDELKSLVCLDHPMAPICK